MYRRDVGTILTRYLRELSSTRSLPIALCLLLAGCATAPGDGASAAATEGITEVSDLYIVDCLLPGQVRTVGGRTYLTPRRPTRTTAVDCRTRGGEYVAYDRADLSSALRVWMSRAEEGDAEAQNTVGEIFERGLGGEPNYEAAQTWYRKAADQGHPAAQLNLGMLYERGLGVPQDRMAALNLYRQSWGLPEDDLVYRSEVERELEALRSELTGQIDEKNSQIRILERQINELQSMPQPSAQAQQELDDLRVWVGRLKSEQAASRQELSALREPQPLPDLEAVLRGQVGRNYVGKDFGRYFALIIGNQDYELMEDLATPISDANRVAQVLQDKYGFTVQVVTNANDLTVMKAMNDLRKIIGENDNLLIYYAGHGSRIQSEQIEFGYWLPTNAHRPPDDSLWIPTEQVTKVMATTPAKRVLIVADSCYAGLLGADFGDRASQAADPRIYQSEWFVENTFGKRARMLISSGGDAPVLDDAGNGNSVFANAFIDVLDANDGLLTTHTLFRAVRERVYDSARVQEIEQIPELNKITKAGHESGEFFFLPNDRAAMLSRRSGAEVIASE